MKNFFRGTRWMLVGYDLFIFTITVMVFFVYYRGGGKLDSNGILLHTGVSFLCLFGFRFVGKVYKQIWRFGGVQSYMLLLFVDVASVATYMILNFLVLRPNISMSKIIAVSTLNTLGSLAMRMSYRYAYKCGNNQTAWGRFLNMLLRFFAGKEIMQYREILDQKKRIAIVGAGRLGVSLAESLQNNDHAAYRVACFVDTQEQKIGRQIQDIPVISGSLVTGEELRDMEVDEVVIAINDIESERRRALFEQYRKMGFTTKVYDYPLFSSAGAKRQLRNFEIEEVLFRKPIEVTDEHTRGFYEGKVVLVTGGGGSIGSELARQVAKMKPKTLVLLDIYENGVYDLQQELRISYGASLDVRIEIVSITNKKGLDRVFREYRPDIVINAAAHKHVPLMENNCIEAIQNNVFGTLNVLELCDKWKVARFMTLSTDKAVNPTNVMGATKRVCEYIMQAYSREGKICCSATRFGNVLGSAGSVIPLFKRQIAAGGPITLTDKRIIRYFMTIPEASQLVLQTGSMAANGEIFVLDMGKPIKILELAENMIRLSGLVPYEDINIVETGLRPGEKLYEELLVKTGELDKTENDLIFIEREEPITMESLQEKLAVLRTACDSGDNDRAREALRSVVPTFYHPEELNLAAKTA